MSKCKTRRENDGKMSSSAGDVTTAMFPVGGQRKASIEISTANISAMEYQIGMQLESSKYSFETNSVLQFSSTDTQQEAL